MDMRYRSVMKCGDSPGVFLEAAPVNNQMAVGCWRFTVEDAERLHRRLGELLPDLLVADRKAKIEQLRQKMTEASREWRKYEEELTALETKESDRKSLPRP